MPDRPEFSRKLTLAEVGPAGLDRALVASPAECAALTARLRIEAVQDVHAALGLRPDADGAILCAGTLTATVVQTCVVSLEPVPQRIAAPVALRLLPPGREPADGPDDTFDEIAADADGTVDLGETLAESLALALDPYPRAPGAEPPAVEPAPNPFAVLATLRRSG